MMQARYTAENGGHFGLAAKYYCHFTSPIRRYPDLEIHRMIKKMLHGELDEKSSAKYRQKMPDWAKHCSKQERVAEDAERDTDTLKKVEFMADKIGEIYEGIISGVTGWGIYVELPNTVEGLVHVAKLPGDYYYYREETYEMVGESTGRTYKLGMKVKVAAVATDKLTRTIDFVIVEEEEE
jgi:ribonuclease R